MSEQMPDLETSPDFPVANILPGAAAPQADLALVQALRGGDEAAFVLLLNRYHTSLIRLALIYAPGPAVAEEIVQETWLGLLQGIDRFEGRSSLKTWLFRILINTAKKRGAREGRQIPFSALFQSETEPAEPAVLPDRFLPGSDPNWPNHWAEAPENWANIPESRLLSQETRDCLLRAIAGLPPGQQEVITLRDVEGWTAPEVCALLGISQANQRVLLHRARAKVRSALEQYLKE